MSLNVIQQQTAKTNGMGTGKFINWRQAEALHVRIAMAQEPV